jgi:hypothetical protein
MRDDDKEALRITLESVATGGATELELVEFFSVKKGKDVTGLSEELQRLGFLIEIQKAGLFKPTPVIAAHIVPALNLASTLEEEIAMCEDLARRFGAIHDGWEGGAYPEYYFMKGRY